MKTTTKLKLSNLLKNIANFEKKLVVINSTNINKTNNQSLILTELTEH